MALRGFIFLSCLIFLFMADDAAFAADIEVQSAQELYDAIDNASDGDTIVIDATGSGGVIDLSGIISRSLPDLEAVNKSLTIKAAGGTTVTIKGDGQQLFAPISSSTETITFENVNFSKGQNSVSVSLYGGGGVFDQQGAMVDFPMLIFRENSLLVFDGNVSEYTNTTNQFQHRGGGVFSCGQATFDVSVGRIVFKNNTATYSDEGSAVEDNVSYYYGGGAVYMTDMTFSNSGEVLFENNKAVFGSQNDYNKSIYCAGGGAILGQFEIGDDLLLSTQTFSNRGNVSFLGNQVHFLGMETGNQGTSGGGGAIMGGKQVFENNGDVLFQDNGTQNDLDGDNMWGGGAITGGIQTFKNASDVIYMNNAASAKGDGYGGAVIFSFSGGHTYENQGDVLYQGNQVEGGNNAWGGAIYGNRMSARTMYFRNTGNVLFSGNNAVSPTGGAEGGAFWALDAEFTNDGDVDFDGNYAHGKNASGGAVYSVCGLDFSQKGNLYFRNNYAISDSSDSGHGGAIYFTQTGLPETMTVQNEGDACFTDNMCTGLGGAGYFKSGTLTLAPKSGKSIVFQGNRQNVTFDGLTPDLSTGEANAFYLAGSGHLEFNPEQNAVISFYDPIQSNNAASSNSIVMDGPGKVKMYGYSDYHGSTDILNGDFFLINTAIFGGTGTQFHDFTLHDGATLGISVDRCDNHAVLNTNTFEVVNGGGTGAGLFVPGVSTLPRFLEAQVYENVIVSNDDSLIQTVTLVNRVTTPLMDAWLEVNPNEQENANLVINWVKDISEVYDFDPHIDVIRQTTVPDTPLGDLFDIIYHTPGDLPAGVDDFAKINTGEPILNAVNGMMLDCEVFSRIMRDRSRDFSQRRSPCLDENTLIRYDFEGNWHGLKGRPGVTRWGMFTQNWSTIESSRKGLDLNYRPAYATFGAEQIRGNWLYGYAGQYIHADSRVGDTSYTNLQTNAVKLGAYASWQDRRKYVLINGQAGAGWNETKTRYAYFDDNYRETYAAGILGTSVEAGLLRRSGCATHPWEWSPHIGFNIYYVGTETFCESVGDLARRFEGVDYFVGELPIGLRLSKTFAFEGGILAWLRPTLDVNYVRSVCDNAPSTEIGFMGSSVFNTSCCDPCACDDGCPNGGSSTICWNQSGTRLGRDIFRMNAGLTGRLTNRVELSANYGLEWRDNYHSHLLFASVARTW